MFCYQGSVSLVGYAQVTTFAGTGGCPMAACPVPASSPRWH
jgi:hypothetical protein